MSHVTEIQTKITDLTALEIACTELGFQFMRDQKTYRWYQTFVGDTPMPEGMTREDLGKSDHAIRIPGCNYEVGVRQQTDGSYRLVYDYWERSMNDALGQNAGPLVQGYAKHETIRGLGKLGHRVIGQQVLSDGSVKIQYARGGSW